MHRVIIRAFPLLLLFLFFVADGTSANAQGMSTYFGVGSASDSAASSPNCTQPRFIDDIFTGNCEPAPTMGGTFGVFGADFMINPHLGVNGEYAFRFAQANYLPTAGVNARPAFYDFNAIYEPISVSKRVVPVLEGGIGGAKLSLYFTQQSCVTTGICTNQSGFLFSNNHFQVHGAFGLKIYVTSNVFIKPQFDAHWVHNLTQDYGRDFVPRYTISIGYTLGEH